MRKYIQLALVIAAVTSIILVIIYERKYSKMKMVLEVLNSFGNREEFSKLKHHKTTVRPEIRIKEEVSWIHIVDSLHLYSAFWERDKNTSSVIILAMILDMSTQLSDVECFLWYDNYPTPLLGTVKLEEQSNKYSGFFVKCIPSNINKVPYGVTLSFKSVNSSLINISRHTENASFVFCVEPLSSGFQDVILLAEHLTFHNNIRKSHFIIYDEGISPKSRKLLEYAKINKYKVDILKWNYPGGALDKDIYHLDCFARSLLVYNTNNVMITTLNEFFVPKHQNLTKILENTIQYKFNVYQFCTEYPDIVAETLKFPFLTLKYTKRLAKNVSTITLYKKPALSIWRKNKVKNNNREILYSDQIVLHRYEKCYLEHTHIVHKHVQDTSMMLYKDVLFTSPLFKYIEGKEA
ncbi:uncharacterized protein [Centruroides vittatus]|uniref:uncharacterized protein n=1 Tax=Centruroides vittatus TaxID=120091 RepID=UPI00350FD3BE